MLFLLLAIFSNSAESIIVRFSEANLHNRRAVTMINYLVATLISAFFVDLPLFAWESERTIPLGLGVLNGILYLIWLVLFQICVGRNGAAMSAIFAKMGVLLPTVGAILCFQERPGLTRVVGIVLALTAVVMFYLPERQAGTTQAAKVFGKRSSLLLILVLVIGGAADFNSKVFESVTDPAYDGLFLFYSFAVCLVLSAGSFLLGKRRIKKQDVQYGVLIGVPNQITTMCLLWAVMRLPASVVFPVHSVCVIGLVSLIDGLVFHSRFSRRQWVSLAMVCVALVLLTFRCGRLGNERRSFCRSCEICARYARKTADAPVWLRGEFLDKMAGTWYPFTRRMWLLRWDPVWQQKIF